MRHFRDTCRRTKRTFDLISIYTPYDVPPPVYISPDPVFRPLKLSAVPQYARRHARCTPQYTQYRSMRVAAGYTVLLKFVMVSIERFLCGHSDSTKQVFFAIFFPHKTIQYYSIKQQYMLTILNYNGYSYYNTKLYSTAVPADWGRVAAYCVAAYCVLRNCGTARGRKTGSGENSREEKKKVFVCFRQLALQTTIPAGSIVFLARDPRSNDPASHRQLRQMQQ